MNKVLLILLTFLGSELMAQSELKTKNISVFKNGKSFVVKEGEVTTINNTYTLPTMPNALFGTLWFTALQSEIVQVTSQLEQVDELTKRKAASFSDLLYANRGKQCTLTTSDGKTYTGVAEGDDSPEDVLFFKTGGKWISLAPSTINSVSFDHQPERNFNLTSKTMKPLVKVQFAKGGKQLLNMMYLQDGISWTPTYQLELLSDTEAHLKLQAEVVNNAEDIASANISFVVGVPNFKFADNMATLVAFVEKMHQNYQPQSNLFSNALMGQMAGLSTGTVATDQEFDNETQVSEDLYFYDINNITLPKGARAHYPLFNHRVKINHLYECVLPSMDNEQSYRNYTPEAAFSFDTKQCNIFHTIQIHNRTNQPFTTGSVMIVDKQQRPLSEDLIKYTSVGQFSSIKLTTSPDIKVTEQEKVIDTQVVKKRGYDYNLLTIQSEVTIVNSKKQDIEMAISKKVQGKSKLASIKYSSKPIPNSSGNNLTDHLSFNLKVAAGKTEVFTYTYEMYVPY